MIHWPGPSRCTTTVKDCPAVYDYLNAQATNLRSYVGSPLWSIVDGSWKLTAFSADGHITFVPNKSYSGPVKPKLTAFREMPFTTDAAEYKALQSPSGNARIDFGYIPQQDAPARPANAAVGANPLASRGYTLAPWPVWGINYTAVNFQSSVSDHAAIIRQLYFREALAYLMNQAAVLSGPLQQRCPGLVQLAGLPRDPAAGDLAAERGLPAHRDRQQPGRRHAAEPDNQHHAGKLVLHEVVAVPSAKAGSGPPERKAARSGVPAKPGHPRRPALAGPSGWRAGGSWGVVPPGPAQHRLPR